MVLALAVAPATSTPADEPTVVERCDGVRTATPPPAKCSAWRVEWVKDGRVWGVSAAADRNALIEQRDRILAFARHDARLFDRAIDPRFDAPSSLICDACAPKSNLGRWGKGQIYSGLAAHNALSGVEERLDGFRNELFETHTAAMADAARLARFAKTKKAAARYTKAIEASVVAVAEYGLRIHNAREVLVVEDAEALAKDLDATKTELERARAELVDIVAKSFATEHAGAYAQEGASSPSELIINVDGTKVTATYSVGGSTSTWFEGQVALDGSVAGRSLMAPEKGELKCKDHSEACGYEYINAVLRFVKSEQTKTQRAELWFQRSTWVQAPVFVRGG